MSNDRLIKGVRAEIASHRLTLNQLKADASGGLLDDGTEVAVSQVLVGCRHILDRAMNVVWASYNTKKPTKQKADVYFPCRDTAEKFTDHLSRAERGNLQKDNPDLFEVIQSCQPFSNTVESWLVDLFTLTQDKHEAYVEIAGSASRDLRIGEGQMGTIKKIVIMPDGSVHADAEMIDAKTGRSEPLKFDFIVRFNQVLRKTGQDPVGYCGQCINRVEYVLDRIMKAVSL